MRERSHRKGREELREWICPGFGCLYTLRKHHPSAPPARVCWAGFASWGLEQLGAVLSAAPAGLRGAERRCDGALRLFTTEKQRATYKE